MQTYAYTLPYLSYMISYVRTDFLTLPYELLNSSDLPYDMTRYGSNAIYLTLYGLLWPYTTYTTFYLIPFYNITLLAIVHMFVLYLFCGCLIPNTRMWSLYAPLVSGTKYSHTLLLNLTLFDFFYILFDWDDSHDQVSKLLKETALCSIGNEIYYHVICGAPLYIQFFLTDTVSYEKETNVDVLGVLAT